MRFTYVFNLMTKALFIDPQRDNIVFFYNFHIIKWFGLMKSESASFFREKGKISQSVALVQFLFQDFFFFGFEKTSVF